VEGEVVDADNDNVRFDDVRFGDDLRFGDVRFDNVRFDALECRGRFWLCRRGGLWLARGRRRDDEGAGA
jgi:hypothetical protein